MKTISLSVSEEEYEIFRAAAQKSARSIAQLIREAMTFYREERLEPRTPLQKVAVLPGHRPLGDLPSRADLYDEIFSNGGERGE